MNPCEEGAFVASGRINTRLSGPLAEFVDPGGRDWPETPSEYVRDLIRRDMEQREGRIVRAAILAGYRDLAEGAVFASAGEFQKDMRVLAEKQADDWR